MFVLGAKDLTARPSLPGRSGHGPRGVSRSRFSMFRLWASPRSGLLPEPPQLTAGSLLQQAPWALRGRSVPWGPAAGLSLGCAHYSTGGGSSAARYNYQLVEIAERFSNANSSSHLPSSAKVLALLAQAGGRTLLKCIVNHTFTFQRHGAGVAGPRLGVGGTGWGILEAVPEFPTPGLGRLLGHASGSAGA